MENEKQQKRQKAPYKKWTDSEQSKILNYLKDNLPIEKPNAQVYYRRCLEEIGIDCELNLLRSKVKNMRQVYNKFKTIQNSTGAGSMTDGETVRASILKKCPLFEELDEVFGYRDDTFQPIIIDTERPCSTEDEVTSPQNQIESNENQFILLQDEIDPSDNQVILPENSSTSTRTRVKKGIYSRTALSDLLEVQTRIIDINKQTKDKEVKIQEDQLALEREKFLFEKSKLEMEKELKIMEIEMKREIALKELELKEKLANVQNSNGKELN